MDSFDFNKEIYKKDWRYQDGEYTVTRTTQWSAPGCHAGCVVLVYTDKDGKVVRIEGDPQSDMTQGRLCMRCFVLPELMYGESRIAYPMKRAREDRGKDKWERITWDEAYDLLEEKYNEVCEKYGKRSIVVTQGTGRNIMWISRMWAYQVFDTPNFCPGFLSGEACYAPRVVANSALAGGFVEADVGQFHARHLDDPDFRVPDCIAVWGCNPLISNADGFYAPLLGDCVRHGSKLIVIDPRVTWLGAKAEYMLQIRPGTDGAMALGLINVIIQEDLYDHEFVANWCYGFEQLAQRAAEFPPERVEEITWVPKEKIIAAARFWATCGTVALKWGLAFDQQYDAVGAAHGALSLEAITGNIEKPGGLVLSVKGTHVDFPFDINGQWNFVNDLDPELCKDRIGYGISPFRSGPNGGAGYADQLIRQVETDEPFPVRMWLAVTNDFLTCMGAQQKRIYEALMDKLDFFISVDVRMTPTCMAFGDLYLPAGFGPERDGLRDWFVPMRAITKCTTVGEAKSDEQIVYEAGMRLHPNRYKQWANHIEMMEFFVHDINTMPQDLEFDPLTLKELQEGVEFYPKREYERYRTGKLRKDGQLGFETASGRIELYSTFYGSMGFDPLPWFEEPPRSPLSTPEKYAEQPFVLTTGRRSWEFFHAEHRESKMMREFHPDPLFEINPEDAAAYGIEEGDWVWLENDFGKAKFRARINPGILKGVLSAEHAWAFPEEGPEDKGYGPYAVFRSNANQLTSLCEDGPTTYGAPYKSQLCKIYKAD